MNDDMSRIRKIERELYTTDIQPPNRRAFLHDRKVEAPDDWARPAAPSAASSARSRSGGSVFRKLFLFSVVVFLASAAFLAFSFLFGNNSISSQNVDLSIATKSFVDGGEDLAVDVTVVNRNKLPLELATLVLEYPEGSAQDAGTLVRITRDIGTLGVGESRGETFDVQLYGAENSARQITAHLEFRVSGSNAVYDRDEVANVTIRTSPIRLTLDAPEKVIPNQEVPLTFTIVGNGTSTLPNTALVLDYPDGFAFTRADPVPSFGSNVWYLGDVPPGVNRKITVYGTFDGSEGAAATIKASVGLQNRKNEALLDTTYNSVAQAVPLTSAFLDARITAGSATGDTVAIGANTPVTVTIQWTNTLASQVMNAEIHAKISGSAFDPSLVQPSSGYFDTVNNQVIWTRQQDPALAQIDPGASGTVSFVFTPKSSGGTTSVTNPVVNISVDVQGVPAGGVRQSATGIAKKSYVVSSDLGLVARTLHYGGSITNSGPMPPVANKETTYALEWQVTNFRNRVTNVTVSTTLPVYVDWKNIVVPQSQADNVTYNEVTRTLVWNVGDVLAGTGGTLPAKTLSLKVGLTPSAAQKGAPVDLTGDITVSGHDDFTKADLQSSRRAMTTQLLNDTSAVGADGIVGG